MPETNQKQSGLSFLTVLVLLLVAAVGTQTWVMVEMKQTLDAIQSDQDSSKLPGQHKAEVATKSEIKNTVDHPDNETALAQSKAVKRKTLPDEKSITPDIPASSSPPPPAPENDNLFNTPPYVQRWNPHEEIERMQRQVERAFNDRYFDHNYYRPDFRHHFRQHISVPEIDMREDQNQYIVLVNIPGAERKDISVNLEGQQLTVAGKQEYKKQDRDVNGRIIFSERRSGRFQRSITLPSPVEKKGMQTRINNGILRITIPKKK